MILTAYFGRSCEELSVKGLEELSTHPEIRIVSVTCGRRVEDKFTDGPLQAVAKKLQLPIMTFQEFCRSFRSIDLVISFSNPVLFPPDFIRSVHFGCVNMHPAPLPIYRGCHSIEHALLRGDPRFGATLHYCDEGIDTGPIIDVLWIDIGPNDTASDVWHKVDEVAILLLRKHIPRIISAAAQGRMLPSQPQNEELAHYYADGSISSSQINLNWSWDYFVRFVRAMQHPHREPAFFVAHGHKVILGFYHGDIVITAIIPY